MTASFGCDADGYRPTWWLPRTTETRRASYHRIVANIACRHGIPTRLLDAVIAQESGFSPRSISRVGAMGMMQIMPGTARSLGLSNPFDPIANMIAGARYLRQQLDRFGRVDLALAAYNAGPERRSLRLNRIPAIPETQHYVRTILTNWGRLIELDQANAREPDRGELAMLAVRASGYRDVELIRYDGLNAANPM
jgi:soluble lytic murein transglycosylase-like protein